MTQETAGEWEVGCWRMYSLDDIFFSILSTSGQCPGHIPRQDVSDTAKSLQLQMLEVLLRRFDGKGVNMGMYFKPVFSASDFGLGFSSGALHA